jgi:cytidine deaminase
MRISEQDALALLQSAAQAAKGAYAPYSHFPVGAALLTDRGEVVPGCNVENASYGLTLCAERVALVKAVSEGKRRFTALAVWADARPYGAVTPCGACRQMLAEFLPADCPVVFSDAATGAVRVLTMGSLLPEAFGLAAGADDNSPDTSNSTPGG